MIIHDNPSKKPMDIIDNQWILLSQLSMDNPSIPIGRRSRRAPVLQWLRWLQHFGAPLVRGKMQKRGAFHVGKDGKRWEKSDDFTSWHWKISWFHQQKRVIFCNEGDNFWDCSWKIDYRNCSPKYMWEEWEWQLIARKFVKSEHDQHVSTLGKCFEMLEILEPSLRFFPTWMAMHVGENRLVIE